MMHLYVTLTDQSIVTGFGLFPHARWWILGIDGSVLKWCLAPLWPDLKKMLALWLPVDCDNLASEFTAYLMTPMFPVRYFALVNALIMSIMMVFIMTAIITAANTGLDSGFTSRWVHAFAIAWPVAFVLILTIGKRTQQLSRKLCSKS